MALRLKVDNINCQNCANLIKNALEGEFGEIDIDVANKIVTANVETKESENFCTQLDELGFSVAEILE